MGSIRLKTEIPGPRSREWMARRTASVPRGVFHVAPIFVEGALGATLTDVDGNRFLDFASGIGVTNVGHRHPSVLSAIRSQLERFLHVSFNVSPYEGYVRLAEKLNELTPGNFPKKTFLANSGAEAVENAIKIARAFTKRPAIICFEHAFHGRTYLSMSLTHKAPPYKAGFGPMCPEVYRAPFPDRYRWATGGDSERVSDECFVAFAETASYQVGVDQIAAVILEPVLGEGGFIPAPALFLKRLREFCSQFGIVLIADEIQTGFGRTGTLFASEQLDFVPDLICSAKGLGGGLPISAVTGRAEIMDAPKEGGIGGTFGGNPLACSAALAVIDQFESSDMLSRTSALTKILTERLSKWKETFPIVGDVRGLGPMRAIELVKPGSKTANPAAAKAIIEHAWKHGLLLMNAGTHANVVRFLPPINIDPLDLNEGLQIVEDALLTLPCE